MNRVKSRVRENGTEWKEVSKRWLQEKEATVNKELMMEEKRK